MRLVLLLISLAVVAMGADRIGIDDVAVNSGVTPGYVGGTNNKMVLGDSEDQIVASAYVFGGASLAFATIPFSFVILKAWIDSKKPDVLPSSVFGVIILAFAVHFISCISFMTLIKVLDTVSSIYGKNYFQTKVFPMFWADAKASAIAANEIKAGAYLILYSVQVIRDWVFLLMPPAVLSLGAAFGTLQAKKDTYRQNGDFLNTGCWAIGSMIMAAFLFILWSKIADIAMFNPSDTISWIQDKYTQMIIAGAPNQTAP